METSLKNLKKKIRRCHDRGKEKRDRYRDR